MNHIDLIAQLRRFYLQHQITIGKQGLLLAVSGGRDSMALLAAHSLWAARGKHAAALPLSSIHIVTVNHGLRLGAQSEVELVQRFCQSRGLLCHVVTLNPQQDQAIIKERGILDWARRQRYEACQRLQKEYGLQWLATAHHQDDLVETLFLRLIRGASPGTLLGMRPKEGHLLRPFLDVPRLDIEAFVSKHQIPYLDDPSNEDLAHPRAWVRQKLLPLLNETADKALYERTITLMRDIDEDNALLEELAKAHTLKAPLLIQNLRTLPTPLLRRTLRSYLIAEGINPLALTRHHITAALHLLTHAGEVRLPGGRSLKRTGAALVLDGGDADFKLSL